MRNLIKKIRPRSVITVLAAVFAAGVLFNFQSEKSDTHHKSKASDLPDFFATNVIVTRMDNNGQIASKTFSPKVTHYPDDATTTLESPYFVLFSENNMPWQIKAKYGKYFSDDGRLDIWEDVEIHQPKGPRNDDLRLLTTEGSYFPKRHFAQTDKPVTILQPGTVVKGVGMTMDTQQGVVNLLSNARGRYDPSNKTG